MSASLADHIQLDHNARIIQRVDGMRDVVMCTNDDNLIRDVCIRRVLAALKKMMARLMSRMALKRRNMKRLTAGRLLKEMVQ